MPRTPPGARTSSWSISSSDGRAALACATKRARADSEEPMTLLRMVAALTTTVLKPDCCAIDRARVVLPVPDGPWSTRPRAGGRPVKGMDDDADKVDAGEGGAASGRSTAS